MCVYIMGNFKWMTPKVGNLYEFKMQTWLGDLMGDDNWAARREAEEREEEANNGAYS